MRVDRNTVSDMNYPDFVAFIGQVNTPPGGRATVSIWNAFAQVEPESLVLDLACSTGFSGRTLHEATRCHVIGLDISASAIAVARRDVMRHGLCTDYLRYLVADAARLPFRSLTFTHILAGCSFGFINNRDAALGESARVLQRSGSLLVAPFYYRKEPPGSLLDTVADSINYRPNPARSLSFWKRYFDEHFDLESEAELELPMLEVAEIESIVERFIYGESEAMRVVSDEVRDACCARLLDIRLALNEHRRYQGCSIMHWRRP